jgi:hypothetical protein
VLSAKVIAAMVEGGPRRLSLPEHRQVELYTKRVSLDFDEPVADATPYALLADVVRAFHTLETALAARLFDGEPQASWSFYTALPRDALGDKLASQLYRILRVAKLTLFHPGSKVACEDGLVKITGVVGPTVMALEITPLGLTLLDSAVAFWALNQSSPYPAAYVEALLNEYFEDIVGEIKRYSDEGRSLYQFRRAKPFCRHFRLDCDNPKWSLQGERVVIEIGPRFRDPARCPIDFFLVFDDVLHIVPVEALVEGGIARAELTKWRARLGDGQALPAEFRARFSHPQAAINQPMV